MFYFTYFLLCVGENGQRIIEKIEDHSGRDHASHMVKHNIETTHTDVNIATFKIINMNFSNRKKPLENCRVFMDQRPETYTKCTGEINTFDAL